MTRYARLSEAQGGDETMKRMLLAAMLATLISGPAWGYDGQGRAFVFGAGSSTCSTFLGKYARSDIRSVGDDHTYNVEFGVSLGWITGYLTHVNVSVPGKANHFAAMSVPDIAGWVASWCRDNPSKSLSHAVSTFVKTKVP